MKDSARRYIAGFLLVLFTAFAAANSLCMHTHIGPAGTVTHSHPYLPSSGHGHTAAQLESIAAINALCYDGDSGTYAIAEPATVSVVLVSGPAPDAPDSAPQTILSLRAPPVM